jgi:hypothetical protein
VDTFGLLTGSLRSGLVAVERLMTQTIKKKPAERCGRKPGNWWSSATRWTLRRAPSLLRQLDHQQVRDALLSQIGMIQQPD